LPLIANANFSSRQREAAADENLSNRINPLDLGAGFERDVTRNELAEIQFAAGVINVDSGQISLDVVV
jgi:hypothetical protein